MRVKTAVLLFTIFVFVTPNLVAQNVCQSIGGVWNDGLNYWNLSHNPNTNAVTGTMYVAGCSGGVYWNITSSSFNTNTGGFSITTQGNGCANVNTIQISGTLDKTTTYYCAGANVTWVDNTGTYPGRIGKFDAPSGETTNALTSGGPRNVLQGSHWLCDWENTPPRSTNCTAYVFAATLPVPTGVRWGGRYIQEHSYVDGMDTCVFGTSVADPFIRIDNPPPPAQVGSVSQGYVDYVGRNPVGVIYYKNNVASIPGFPCTATIYQQMDMLSYPDPNSPPAQMYQRNTLTSTIFDSTAVAGMTDVQTTRDTAQSPRKVWPNYYDQHYVGTPVLL